MPEYCDRFKEERGQVRGPRQIVKCAEHKHVVDTTKMKDGKPLIVAKSVEEYERKFDFSGRPRA